MVTPEQDPAGPRPTRVRIGVAFLIFAAVVVNYMDRSNLALVAPAMSQELGLSAVKMGLIFSAFGWAYAAAQLPGGWIVDRIAPRLLYPIMMGAWSLVTCAHVLARGFAGLFAVRLGVGAFEAPSYPTNNRIVTTWFPESERARATSFYISGQFVGVAFLTWASAHVEARLGWRGVFVLTGAVGLLFSGAWYLLYRDPPESTRVNRRELDQIRAGGGLPDRARPGSSPKVTGAQLRAILTTRNLWGVIIGHTAINATLWFFLTWFPTYLVKYRHMGLVQMGNWSTVPFAAAFVGALLSGYFSDRIVRRGGDVATARKIPIICGLLLSASIVGANYVESPRLAMLFMTLAFFGNGLASIGWTFVSALAPEGLLGLTGGIYNFMGYLAAIAVPIIIGFIVQNGRFEPALVFISAWALLGVLSFLFLVRDVERIKVPPG